MDDWAVVLKAANGGDSLAIDYLIGAKLKEELPSNVNQIFTESCFLYWIKDGPYDDVTKKFATIYEPDESSEKRDTDACRIDVRFIDAVSMSRFLGLGLEGSWKATITFHPLSTKKIRVSMTIQESQISFHQMEYKLVRSWKSPRVNSVRTIAGLPRKGNSRGIWYVIKPSSEKAQLTMHISLSETPECKVLGADATAICINLLDQPGVASNHRVQVDMFGGNFCSVADWNADPSVGAVDCHHGSTHFRFTASEEILTVSDVSEMRVSTMWLLQGDEMHTFRVSANHENKPALRREIVGKLSKWFSESPVKSKQMITTLNSLSIFVTCDLGFIDVLSKMGTMRRVREFANHAVTGGASSARF
jgi:hypothetical protein